MSIYTDDELQCIGFTSIGRNVRISKKASIYNPGKISIGNNVRIDDFCVISAGDGGIQIGSYIHIAVFCSLIGSANIKIDDFSNMSSRVSIYSSSDDYSGETMTNPMVPDIYKKVLHEDVCLDKHVIIGAGAVILPGVYLETGVAVGSLSLVTARCSEFGIYAGVPARRIGDRKRNLLELEKRLLSELSGHE